MDNNVQDTKLKRMIPFLINEKIENYSPNYLATICKLGTMERIEGSDHLMKTVVNGFTMVISDDMREGDIVVYFPVETGISEKYLSANNLYCIGEYERNANSVEVHNLLAAAIKEAEQGETEEAKVLNDKAKSMVGFFDKKGRVRIIKLRGVYSEGFLAGVSSLEKYKPELTGIDWESLIGTRFNCIDDDVFCWKYIPTVKTRETPTNRSQRGFRRRMKAVKKFDKLIPGQWAFHYDTVQLNGEIDRFKPEDIVTISTKCHGTSAIFGNILINRKLTTWERIKKFFGANVPTTEYGNIYSSRTVIKNRYINEGATQGFYDVDVWGAVNEKTFPYIERGMTVYGEIVGYLPGSDKMIQKNHDYGCKPGQWKFMPYRITKHNDDGSLTEYNVLDVQAWTKSLLENHPELLPNIMLLDILYHGKLKDLYPDLPVDKDWNANLLERMKNDKEHFLMEELEPMCHLYEKEADDAKKLLDAAVKNKTSKKEIKSLTKEYEKWQSMRAPREGIVIRKDDDPIAEAFKLKTAAHYNREAKQHDDGEVDIEETA